MAIESQLKLREFKANTALIHGYFHSTILEFLLQNAQDRRGEIWSELDTLSHLRPQGTPRVLTSALVRTWAHGVTALTTRKREINNLPVSSGREIVMRENIASHPPQKTD